MWRGGGWREGLNVVRKSWDGEQETNKMQRMDDKKTEGGTVTFF